jgi:hypothetical protein
MRQVMVRYKVKPERAAENEQLVRAVYDQLRDVAPDGFQYGTFQLGDGTTFVHFALTADDGPGPLPQLEAFRRFQDGIAERCDEPPVVTELRQIGSYELVDAGDRS